MLKGVHPLLTADLLHALRAMGHGDATAVVDANFPAAGMGPPVIELAGVGAPQALHAILVERVVALVTATLRFAVVELGAQTHEPVFLDMYSNY